MIKTEVDAGDCIGAGEASGKQISFEIKGRKPHSPASVLPYPFIFFSHEEKPQVFVMQTHWDYLLQSEINENMMS